MADMTKQFEESALLKTTAQPGMFILKKVGLKDESCLPE